MADASRNLREERVTLIKLKAKEVLGKDVDIKLKDVNTDVKVSPDLNQLATTSDIVRENADNCGHLMIKFETLFSAGSSVVGHLERGGVGEVVDGR